MLRLWWLEPVGRQRAAGVCFLVLKVRLCAGVVFGEGKHAAPARRATKLVTPERLAGLLNAYSFPFPAEADFAFQYH